MCEEIWGSGKFFMATPFRSLENAPFLENVPSREAKDSQPMELGVCSNFEILDFYDIERYGIFERYW